MLHSCTHLELFETFGGMDEITEELLNKREADKIKRLAEA